MPFLNMPSEVVVHERPWEGGWAWAITIGADPKPVAAGWSLDLEEARMEAASAATGWRAVAGTIGL